MSHAVRVTITGTIEDYEGFSSFAKRAAEFVQDNEPGTEAWECFADQDTGSVFFHEIYDDEDAFLTHVQNMTEQGLMGEFVDLVSLQDVIALGRIEDERVKEVAAQFGARSLHGLAGVARAHG